jgi:hypothetical protein
VWSLLGCAGETGRHVWEASKISLAARVFRAPNRRVPLTAADIVREVALLSALFVVYQAVRWIAIGDVQHALSNAHLLVGWERHVGIYVERPVQAWILGSDVLLRLLSAFYLFGLYPLMLFLAVITFVANRELYRWARNAILISWSIALVAYVGFPVAPPRFLADEGFTDAVFGGARSLGLPWTNQYAAMPSMHEGFAVIFGVTLYRLLVPWLGWPLALGLPALMFVSIVGTANHFIVDALAGAVVVTFAMLVARAVEGRRAGVS